MTLRTGAERIETIEIGGQSLTLVLSPDVWAPSSFAHSLAPLIAERVRPGMRVLELGLGSGVLAILAGKLGASVVGLDINPASLALASDNWRRNGLPDDGFDFRASDRLSALTEADVARFDLVWSNPPVLPALVDVPEVAVPSHAFEVSGATGRGVLDAILTESGRFLKPDAAMLVIATSLQGWSLTRDHLERHWRDWQIAAEHDLALTEEYTPRHIAWWRDRGTSLGEDLVTALTPDASPEDGAAWSHKVWILAASGPRAYD